MFWRRRALALGVALAVGLVGSAGPAFANGRFPTAQQLVVHPKDPNRVWLRATHGILTSADRGATWHWICEQSVNYSGTEDPSIGVTASGRFLAGIFKGLSQTTDNGCNFDFEPTIGDQNIEDLSVEKGDPARALVLTSSGAGGGGFVNEVWRTTDSGATWAKVGLALERTLTPFTIDSAPSDPGTIYVTGFVPVVVDGGTGDAGPDAGPDDAGSQLPTKGVLLRSADSGQTWESIDIPGTDYEHQPFLSAIDPTDPKKIYVRVWGVSPGANSTTFVENSLIYSDNGGDTFREVLKGNADFLGFALAPDGQTVFVGMGDSRELGQTRPDDESFYGLYRATLPELRFERIEHSGGVAVGPIGCLTFDGEDLWVCTSEFKQGFELARSSDRGVTLQPVMHLRDLQGPLQCPSDTSTGAACPSQWPPTCEKIGRCDPASTGGASGNGGGSGASGSDSSCGCRAPGDSSFGAGALVALLAAAGSLFVFARRRRH